MTKNVRRNNSDPMVTSSDGKWVKLSHYLDRLTHYLNIAGSLLIVLVMLLVNADVLGRTLFNYPIAGVPELVSLSIVAIVFLQIPYAFKVGRLTRANVIPDLVRKYSIRARGLLELVLCCGAGFIMVQLLTASLPLFLKSWQRGTFEGTVGSFTVPSWPVKLIILIGGLTLIGQIVCLTLRSLRTVVKGQEWADGRNTIER